MVFLNSWHQIDMVSASGGSTVDVSNPSFQLSTFQPFRSVDSFQSCKVPMTNTKMAKALRRTA